MLLVHKKNFFKKMAKAMLKAGKTSFSRAKQVCHFITSCNYLYCL